MSAATPEANAAYQARLNTIYQRIHDADRFDDIVDELEEDLLTLLDAERMTIYQRDPDGSEIVAIYRSGDDGTEIRLPLGPTSIAGYVALSQKPLRIDDVYDGEALASIHPHLTFDFSFDQATGFLTENMVTVPIKSKRTLLGVLQVINKRGGGLFSDQDVIHALAIGNVIGQKFRYDLRTTQGPFDLLLQQDLIKPDLLDDLEEKASTTKLPITYLLRNEGEVDPMAIGASLEQFFQVPFLEYNPAYEPSPTLLDQLNPEYLAKQLWVPFDGQDGSVIILTNDPNDSDQLMEIQQLLNAPRYDVRVGLPEDILAYLGYEIQDETEIEEPPETLDDIVHKLEEKQKVEVQADSGDDDDSELLNENESSVIQLVNRMIVDAVEMGASDIHIEAGVRDEPATVRMRVDGVCRAVLQIPKSHLRAVIARIKVISRLDIAEHRKPQDGKISVRMSGSPLELRVATLPTVNGEGAILRVLAAGEPLPLEKLNFSERNYQILMEALTHPHGIFLVVGPTGSGKTTTLHGVLGHINTPDRTILTAEDPVEITQRGLQQVQMQPKIGLTFATALRAFLRSDPDVILIGEMRDFETAHAGMEASLTGHLVFSTLHTNSASETVTRLLDMGLDPLNFADALVGVLAQRLARTLCKECAEPYEAGEEELERLRHLYGEEVWPELGIEPGHQLMKPVGCAKCGDSGYKGRTGVHELMAATPEMKKLISERGNVTSIRELALKQGMRTLLQDGVLKVLKGQLDLAQLRKVTAAD